MICNVATYKVLRELSLRKLLILSQFPLDSMKVPVGETLEIDSRAYYGPAKRLSLCSSFKKSMSRPYSLRLSKVARSSTH